MERFPNEMVAAVKRAPEYRRYRCHLADRCPIDVWSSSSLTFVVFQAFLGSDGATHLAFALNSRTREITHVKLIDMTDSTIQAWTPERLTPCDVHPRVAPDIVVSV